MDEKDLQVFVDGATHYFSQTSAEPAKVSTPYLLDSGQAVTYGYTGIIGIAGARKGCVYFTAPAALLKHLLLNLGEKDMSHTTLCDLVGEVANTISGNARQHFGKDFMISVPTVVDGELDQIRLPEALRSFIIPVNWHDYEAAVVISLQ